MYEPAEDTARALNRRRYAGKENRLRAFSGLTMATIGAAHTSLPPDCSPYLGVLRDTKNLVAEIEDLVKAGAFRHLKEFPD
jgi:hypothetical protein